MAFFIGLVCFQATSGTCSFALRRADKIQDSGFNILSFQFCFLYCTCRQPMWKLRFLFYILLVGIAWPQQNFSLRTLYCTLLRNYFFPNKCNSCMYHFVKMLSLSGNAKREVSQKEIFIGKCNVFIRRVFRFSILT